MRTTKSFTVDRDGSEVVYACTQLGAWEGSKALIRAQKIAYSGVNGFDVLIQTMTEADLEYFSRLFAKTTFVTYTNDKEQRVKKNLAEIFEHFFAGQYFEMVQWLVFCLGHDFGNYFFLVQTNGEKIKIMWSQGSGQSLSVATDSEIPTQSDPEP